MNTWFKKTEIKNWFALLLVLVYILFFALFSNDDKATAARQTNNESAGKSVNMVVK